MKSRLLSSQRNSKAVARRIRGAFQRKFHRRGRTFFEHGHWWIEVPQTGEQWDAVDTQYGFDFEKVSYGDAGY